MSTPTAVETFIGLAADEWTAIGTVALALIALVTAVVAIRQISEARSSGRDAMRAYVSATFELHRDKHFVIEFVVRNSGRTAASEVRFNWVGPIPTRTAALRTQFADAKLFRGIPTLAPDREIRIFFDTTHTRLNAPDIQHEFSIDVTYTDRFQKTHIDRFDLDTEIYRDAHSTGLKTIDDVGKALEIIANAVNKSTSGQGRFHVVTETRAHWVARWFTRADGLRIRSKNRRTS